MNSKTQEIKRIKKWYKFYFIAAIIALVGSVAIYAVTAPSITIDFVIAVALFVLIASMLQSFNLIIELEDRVSDLEEKLGSRSTHRR